MSDDYISRQAVINAFYIQSDDDGWWTGTAQDVEELLNSLQSTQLKPKTGYWIYTDYHTWCCSECGGNPHRGTGFVPNKDGMKMRWKYCNLCGARMVEPQESEEI